MRIIQNQETQAVDIVLKTLHDQRHSRLASTVPELSYSDNSSPPGRLTDLQGLQRLFLHNEGAPTATIVSSPVSLCYSGTNSSVDGAGPRWSPEDMVLVDVAITQVPGEFVHPVLAKRKWDPPFKIAIKCASKARLSMRLDIRAYSVDEHQVECLEEWSPPSDSGLSNSVVSHTLQLKGTPGSPVVTVDTVSSATDDVSMCAAGSEKSSSVAGTTTNNSGTTYSGFQEFTFTGLSFEKPSQVRPRWLVFEVSPPGIRARLYLQLLLPTIVMSRAAEQLDKCTGWLLKTEPLVNLSDPTAVELLAKELQQGLGLRRQLTAECLKTVAKNATLLSHSMDASGEAVSMAHAHNSLYGAVYLSQTKRLLHMLRPYFDRTDATIISDVSIQRDDAERLLADCPAGTFLLRFGSEAGTLVSSTALPDGSVEHMKIGLDCLKRSSLEIIMSSNPKALMLIDVKANKLYPKSAVLQRGYVPPTLVKQAVRSSRPAKRVMHSASPTAAGTTSMMKQSSSSLGKRYAPVSEPYPPAAAAAAAHYTQQGQPLPQMSTAQGNQQQQQQQMMHQAGQTGVSPPTMSVPSQYGGMAFYGQPGMAGAGATLEQQQQAAMSAACYNASLFQAMYKFQMGQNANQPEMQAFNQHTMPTTNGNMQQHEQQHAMAYPCPQFTRLVAGGFAPKQGGGLLWHHNTAPNQSMHNVPYNSSINAMHSFGGLNINNNSTPHATPTLRNVSIAENSGVTGNTVSLLNGAPPPQHQTASLANMTNTTRCGSASPSQGPNSGVAMQGMDTMDLLHPLGESVLCSPARSSGNTVDEVLSSLPAGGNGQNNMIPTLTTEELDLDFLNGLPPF